MARLLLHGASLEFSLSRCSCRVDESADLVLPSVQVCALAIDGLRCQTTQLVLTPDERKRCVTHTYFALSQRLMQLGDGTGRPQVRYIQCVTFSPSLSLLRSPRG